MESRRLVQWTGAPLFSTVRRVQVEHPSRVLLLCAVLAGATLQAGCATDRQPSTTTDICRIFDERPHWYRAAVESRRKWGAPVHVQMAIIWRESGFRPRARAPRVHLFGLIPMGRASTSKGFTQAIDGTWDWYVKSTGNRGASRSSFEDSADFVGWYTRMSRRLSKVRQSDAYRQYLAYHEGHGNFNKGSYKGKANVRKAAREVQEMADRYARQLRRCRSGALASSALEFQDRLADGGRRDIREGRASAVESERHLPHYLRHPHPPA